MKAINLTFVLMPRISNCNLSSQSTRNKCGRDTTNSKERRIQVRHITICKSKSYKVFSHTRNYHARRNYVVISTTKTLNLLYADAFLPLLKFCITSTPQEAGCTLTCSAGVKWYKSIMVKCKFKKKKHTFILYFINCISTAIVSRAAMKGMSDTIQALIPLIQQEQKETSSTLTPSSSPRPSEKSSVARDNIVEPATASASSQQVTTRKPSLRQLVLTGAGWIVSLCVVLFLLWMRQGSRKDYEAGISSSCDHHKQQQQPVVMWRAVFLRDLVPHLLGQNISTVDLDLHINPM